MFIRKIMYSIASFVVLAAVFQLVAPKTVRSAVTALVSVVGNVSVTNPLDSSGSPQPLLVRTADTLPQQPYMSIQSCNFNLGHCVTSNTTPDPGKVLVLNDVSGSCQFALSPGSATSSPLSDALLLGGLADSSVEVEGPGTQLGRFEFPVLSMSSNGGLSFPLFGRTTSIVVDGTAGQSYRYMNTVSSVGDSGGNCTVNFNGYYVNR